MRSTFSALVFVDEHVHFAAEARDVVDVRPSAFHSLPRGLVLVVGLVAHGRVQHVAAIAAVLERVQEEGGRQT